MGKKLVLLGGGGHCKSVLDAAIRMNQFEEIVITDPFLPVGTKVMGMEVVGSDEALPKLKEQGFTDAFVTVGSLEDCSIRKKLVSKAKKLGFSFPIIADPSAEISAFAEIGEGTFIGKKAVLNAEVKVGKQGIVNTGAILEHECCIGDFTHISVGTILCGDVKVGASTFIGAGTTVIQGVSIGEDALIGANSTVLRNVKDHNRVYGIVK